MAIMFKSPLFSQDIFQEMVQTAENNSYIDPQLHERFNTKRGLRNSDGTGVLVGLTAIGDVHSYIMDEL
jgi:citrate synthase